MPYTTHVESGKGNSLYSLEGTVNGWWLRAAWFSKVTLEIQ